MTGPAVRMRLGESATRRDPSVDRATPCPESKSISMAFDQAPWGGCSGGASRLSNYDRLTRGWALNGMCGGANYGEE